MLTVIVILVLVSAAAYFAYKKYLAGKEETDLVKEALASLKIVQEDLPPYNQEQEPKKPELDALAQAQQAKAEADARVAIAEKVVEKANEVLSTPVETKPAPKRYYRRKNKPKK